MGATTTRLSALAALALGALAAAGCTNPEVEQGHEGYIYHVPLAFGQMEFRESLRGPATTGVSWRLYGESIDMRAKSYKEDFDLLTRDNLSVSFEVNTRIELRDRASREIVEEWGGVKWYEWNVKEQLRTIVREQVTRFSATDIQLETPKVRKFIEEKLRARFNDTPVSIQSVDVGQIQFPKEVAEAISRKIAKKQELERQEFVLAKTRKEAAIRVLEALRVAKQQRIISSTLDPLYVQQRAVQVYRALSQSPNKTIVMLPQSPEGTGLPLVQSQGKRKILSADDEKLLEDMERRYMRVAREAAPSTDPKPRTPEPDPSAAPAGAAQPAAPAQPAPAAPAPASPAPAPAPTKPPR
jgi:regulator of protease activity HflC (stomatin/prohibitin superfamily)